jgi:peptidoglycan hydrolase CwlO-like protein
MTQMISEIYTALLEIGVSEHNARQASEAVNNAVFNSASKQDIEKTEQQLVARIEKTEQGLKIEIDTVKQELDTMKKDIKDTKKTIHKLDKSQTLTLYMLGLIITIIVLPAVKDLIS